MNEFVVMLKLIDFKNKKLKIWKFENLKILKFNGYKKFLTLVIIFFKCIYETVKKIIEAGPTKWLKSKDPWKSEWIRNFN